MNKTYKSREEALAYLKDEGFKWNHTTGRHERGVMYISLARAYVVRRRYIKPSRMTWDQWDRLRRSRIRWFFYRLFTRC